MYEDYDHCVIKAVYSNHGEQQTFQVLSSSFNRSSMHTLSTQFQLSKHARHNTSSCYQTNTYTTLVECRTLWGEPEQYIHYTSGM